MTIRTIVVGVDGSEAAQRAVAWAAGLAAQTSARVVAVHTFEPLAHLDEVEPPYDFATMERAARSRLEGDWVRPLVEAGVEHEGRIMHGTPAGCVLDAADEADADLIVVGTRGHRGFREMALGSTSNKVVHSSHRPVVVIPPAGA